MRFWKWEVWPWNWRKVRKANILASDREIFERYGETVVARLTNCYCELFAEGKENDP